jgi:polysaccharide deacetylase family protein (PEP-CTERM system associated)
MARVFNNYRININVLSVDLEDYFMVSAFESVVKREDWERYESHIERNTYRLLEILDTVQIHRGNKNSLTFNSELGIHYPPKATFFCLGWVAERFPHLIKTIHSHGHEIASHGYNHRMITFMSNEEFREDIRRTKAILEDLTGERILGYRAPSYSITRRTLWALEILAEEGYLYDSSIFPIHHDRYGIPDAPRYPFCIEFDGSKIPFQLKKPKYLYEIGISKIIGKKDSIADNTNPAHRTLGSINHAFIVEFPISTLRIFGYNLPIGGGGYFRLFPMWFTLWAMKRVLRKGTAPLLFYIHPWEIDPIQPGVCGVSPISRARHYVNLRKTKGRLEKLLQVMPFSSFSKILEDSNLDLNLDNKRFIEYEG